MNYLTFKPYNVMNLKHFTENFGWIQQRHNLPADKIIEIYQDVNELIYRNQKGRPGIIYDLQGAIFSMLIKCKTVTDLFNF